MVDISARNNAGLVQKIEINCDMREGFGRWKMVQYVSSSIVPHYASFSTDSDSGPDEELIKYIDVANVACGFHAGDPSMILKTVRMAKKHNVKIGAHAGLQDLFGFGRRRIEVDPEDMYASILYQVGALKAFLEAEGVPLNYIKPHGELFLYMQCDAVIMDAVLRAAAVYKVPDYACKTEMQKEMCAKYNLPFQEELYVDLDYSPEGTPVAVAKSKMATPEIIYNRILACAGAIPSTMDDPIHYPIRYEGDVLGVPMLVLA
jgi:lactam utilization protein B